MKLCHKCSTIQFNVPLNTSLRLHLQETEECRNIIAWGFAVARAFCAIERPFSKECPTRSVFRSFLRASIQSLELGHSPRVLAECPALPNEEAMSILMHFEECSLCVFYWKELWEYTFAMHDFCLGDMIGGIPIQTPSNKEACTRDIDVWFIELMKTNMEYANVSHH